MMRSVQDLAAKIARSTMALLPAVVFSKTACRCTTPAPPGSKPVDRIAQSAWAVAAAARRRTAALSFATVFVQQSLKTRIVSQRVPNWIYFQTLHGDSARSAQQSVQDFNRATVVAKNGVNFGHPSCNFRAAKGVFALRKQFGGAPSFSERGIFFSEIGENFRELNMDVCRIGTFFQLRFDEVFCFQEGGSRAGFVLKRFSREDDEIIFATQVLRECGAEEIVRQAFRFAQSFFVFPFQKKNVRARADDPKFVLVVKRYRFHRLKCFLRNAQIAFFGDGQLGLDLPKSHAVWVHFKPAVDRFVGRIEIPQHLVIESKIL